LGGKRRDLRITPTKEAHFSWNRKPEEERRDITGRVIRPSCKTEDKKDGTSNNRISGHAVDNKFNPSTKSNLVFPNRSMSSSMSEPSLHSQGGLCIAIPSGSPPKNSNLPLPPTPLSKSSRMVLEDNLASQRDVGACRQVDILEKWLLDRLKEIRSFAVAKEPTLVFSLAQVLWSYHSIVMSITDAQCQQADAGASFLSSVLVEQAHVLAALDRSEAASPAERLWFPAYAASILKDGSAQPNPQRLEMLETILSSYSNHERTEVVGTSNGGSHSCLQPTGPSDSELQLQRRIQQLEDENESLLAKVQENAAIFASLASSGIS